MQGQPVGERDQQVLAARLDVVDGGADDALQLRATRPATGRGDHLTDQNAAQDVGDPGERVALRHCATASPDKPAGSRRRRAPRACFDSPTGTPSTRSIWSGPETAVGDQLAERVERLRGELRVGERGQRLERLAAALQVEHRLAVDRARRTLRRRGQAAGGRPPTSAATPATRRTGWPGRRRPGSAPRSAPRSPPGSPRSARSRSSAAGMQNCAPPRPSTK